MLEIKVPDSEWFNEVTETFSYIEGGLVLLEHSLLSLSKWESKWKKPFLQLRGSTQSAEELLDYFRCMAVTPMADENWPRSLTNDQFLQIVKYIDDDHTATKIYSVQKPKARPEVITSEVIYYWMVSLHIPFEAERWHLNRLMTLIQVCTIKGSGKQGKMSSRQTADMYAELNEKRLKQYNTRG